MSVGLSDRVVPPFVDHFSTDIFKFDPNYIENEERYKAIKAEILGEDSSDEEGSEESESEEEDEEEGLCFSPLISLFHLNGSLCSCRGKGRH